MNDNLTRRRLLQAAGTAALAGASALGLSQKTEGATNSASAASAPRLLPGICAYSYGRLLKRGRMTMPDFIHRAVDIGSTGADMTVYWFKSTDPRYLDDLRHLAFKNGLPFSGAACHSSMVQATRAERAQVLEDIKKWVDVTDRLGASHLRVFAGKLPPGATLKQGIEWTVEGMKPACEYASKKGITLGIEDHGGITQRADVCLEIMHRVNSPNAGINLDITHFIPTPTQDRYAQIQACVPYATNTHIRDHFDGGVPIDMDRVWRIFAEGGYKGFMSVEYQGKEDPMTGVPKLMQRVRALCQKYSTTA